MRDLIVAVALSLLLAGCGSAEVNAQHDRGVAEAERDIANGTPSILYIGLPGPDSTALDPGIGVPRYSMGCVVSDESLAFEDAYNDRIRDAFDDGELEGMTFLHKMTSGDALRARFEQDGGHELTFETEPLDAPGGRYAVRLAERAAGTNPGDTPYLFVLDRESGDMRELHYVGEARARVLFDHEGTTVLVRDDRFRTYRTFDLPRALALQVFPDPDREW